LSRGGDHQDEMPGPAPFDEATVEAFLSGRPVGAGEMGPLAAFAEDVRVAVDGPPPAPTAEMARLLTEGIPTPTGATRAALAPSADTRGAHVSKRRKPMLISELLAGLLAKLAGLGAASKAALGLGVAAASVTGAGAAGILPDPAQHAVATAVSAATPFEIPDPDDVVPAVGTDDTENGDDTGGDTGGNEPGTAPDNHGTCVSEVARNAPRGPGGVHGRAVSEVARSDCGKSSPSTSTPSPTTTTTSVTTTTLDDGEDETPVGANRGRGGPGSGGNPNQGSSGPGNSGNGSSGPGNSGNGGGNGGGQGSGRSGR
jgi:hypothetical protein